MIKFPMKTYRLFFVFILVLAIFYNSFGQESIIQHYPIEKLEESYLIDKNYILLTTPKNYNILSISQNDSIRLIYQTKKVKNKKWTHISTFYNNDNLGQYYFYSKKNAIIHSSLDKNSNEATSEILYSLKKEEEIIQHIKIENWLILLTSTAFQNEINLHYFLNGKYIKSKTANVPWPSFYNKIAYNNKENTPVVFNSKTELVKFSSKNFVTLKDTYIQKKLYKVDSTIYISFEEPESTHLISFNIFNPNVDYKKLGFSLEENLNHPKKQGNSYIYNHHIHRVTASQSQLNYIIIDLKTMELVSNENIYAHQEDISFKYGFVQTKENFKEIDIIDNNEQLFKKLQRGNLAIAINKEINNVSLTEIGSYEEITTYQNTSPGFAGNGPSIRVGMGTSIGFGGFGGFGFGMPLYDPFYRMNSSPASYTYIRTTSFYCLTDDGYHVQSTIPIEYSSYEQLITSLYINNTKENTHYLYFNTNGKNYLGHYNSKSKHYSIQEIVPKLTGQ